MAGTNRLIHEKSPYLQQHAHNPVDWYPWSEEAFRRAAAEDKPVFLSIGYSTCHWCHVMERESFEDQRVADLLNRHFISIKVDREERPDVDGVYMDVCQLLTRTGGWPLTIVMSPDKRPFFAATYLPRSSRFGQPGMLELLPKISSLWQERRRDLLKSADTIVDAMQPGPVPPEAREPGEANLDSAFRELSHSFDRDAGGFGRAPKFPMPHHISFLLRYWRRTGRPEAFQMVEKTLHALRRGGIFDHVGFGIHRYSTDSGWRLPHFEKMLYDQALLAIAYTEAYQATQDSFFRFVAEEIFTYVLRDLCSPEGAFYSAEDADSEGEEGRFYTWTMAEMRSALDHREYDLAVKVFNLESQGNYREEAGGGRSGRNLLFWRTGMDEMASELDIPVSGLRERLERIRRKLLTIRSTRVRPLRDEKILTDWNGLMIAALAKAARAWEAELYRDAAVRAARFVLDRMGADNGKLLHRHKDGESAFPAYSDDYAFLIWALIELYETTFETIWLEKALLYSRQHLTGFWDRERGGFFFTREEGEPLLVKRKTAHDGAVPSANSVALLNLIRLSRMTGNAEWEEAAARLARSFGGSVSEQPSAHTQMLSAVDFSLGPAHEVVVVGERGRPDTEAMLKSLNHSFLPHCVLMFIPAGESRPAIHRLAPYTIPMQGLGQAATAYVCTNHSCRKPTTDPDEVMAVLKE